MLVGNGSLSTLSFATFCSWLWILCAPLGLQNPQPGTPRFTHFHASLRSYESGSLGIPGLLHYSIDITWYMLTGNGLTTITLSSATSCSALWIFCLPSVVENLTGRTPRFTHLCASLRSFKDGSLGIPGRPARM